MGISRNLSEGKWDVRQNRVTLSGRGCLGAPPPFQGRGVVTVMKREIRCDEDVHCDGNGDDNGKLGCGVRSVSVEDDGANNSSENKLLTYKEDCIYDNPNIAIKLIMVMIFILISLQSYNQW